MKDILHSDWLRTVYSSVKQCKKGTTAANLI